MIHEISCIIHSKNDLIHGLYQFFSTQPVANEAQMNRYTNIKSQYCLSTSLKWSSGTRERKRDLSMFSLKQKKTGPMAESFCRYMMENSPSATVVRDVALCSVIGPRQSQKLSLDLYFSLLLIVQDISIHGATSNLTPSFSFFSASFSFSSPSFIIRNFRRLFQTFVLHLMFTFHISPNISMTSLTTPGKSK